MTHATAPSPAAGGGAQPQLFTSGPWAVRSTVYEHMAVEIVAADRGIAQVWVGPNALANARLMATAPDLFAAAADVLPHRVEGSTRGDLRDNDASRAALGRLAAAVASSRQEPRT